MSFEHALHIILEHEGGYINHPADRGGATNMGITQDAYNEWRGSRSLTIRDVREIEKMEVAAIYRTRYWSTAGCDHLPDKIALVHFDAAVNHGVSRAVKFLQTIVGARPDGAFGTETQRALKSSLDKLTEASIAGLYIAEREDFYDAIVEKNPIQAVFLRGWKNRMARLRTETGVS